MRVAAAGVGAGPAGGAGRAAVIGHPIAHSKSPLLHAAAYSGLGLDWSYTAQDVAPEDLAAFVRSLRADDRWRGLSVTMPHKAAMAALTDANTALVETLGVLNTVTFSGGPGRRVLTGHNTDVAGITGALAHAGASTPRNCLVLGGGGTAAAAVAGLAGLGADRVRVYVRQPERAAGLATAGAALGMAVEVLPWDGARASVRAADVVVSTLPPRAADSLATALPADGPAGVLLDAAYDPWPSVLSAAWARAGGVVVHGLEMLLYQAIEQVSLFSPDAGPLPPAVINRMCEAIGVPLR
ncbi:shikimate dehydrogenase [Arthrobacter zhaoguopingii]|uniref:shikimate dehydrogenase n=1 Tax=Arthrobacter zhaoguopingii TaxID=2681491 RepID=UPI001FEB1003|nr:shikimate dehydrogenase [Arthrobacter zhaoguopingii]